MYRLLNGLLLHMTRCLESAELMCCDIICVYQSSQFLHFHVQTCLINTATFSLRNVDVLRGCH